MNLLKTCGVAARACDCMAKRLTATAGKLGEALHAKAPSVKEFWVVDGTAEHVAFASVPIFCRFFRRICRRLFHHTNCDTMHIGLSGGRTPSIFARGLGQNLVDYEDFREKFLLEGAKYFTPEALRGRTLKMYGMVGPMDSKQPDIEPNAYVTILTRSLPGIPRWFGDTFWNSPTCLRPVSSPEGIRGTEG